MIDTAAYLGSALVTRTEDKVGYVQIRMPDGDHVWARMALAVAYQPVEGDEVLAIAQDPEHAFVIGVLRGSGPTSLRVPGDFSIEAPNGSIRLSAPHILMRTGKFEVVARRILETARDLYCWVSELFHVKSYRMKTAVESSYHLKAGQAHLKSDLDMNIDGSSINLG